MATLTDKLTHCTELKEKLDTFRPLQSDIVKQLKADMQVRFTYNSNAIEGNTLTIYETKAVLEDGITISGKSMNEHLEAINHKEALNFLEELVQQDEELTERTIRDIHAIILQGIDRDNAGTYRTKNVIISGANHTPPEALQVPPAMGNFIAAYATWKDMHPVERAARVHAEFVNIHPFIDGNGRTSRLLMNLELMKAGYPPLIIPVEGRATYYANLDTVAIDGDYAPFLEQLADLCITSFDVYWRLLQ
ncbi:MAG: Fic family protein [Desulfovibrio sp.]